MNSDLTDLHYKTITEIAPLLRARQISSVELTTLILRRIETVDAGLRSYITVMADQALAAARRADEALAAGQDRGLLHGIPIAVKDLCFTKGVRTMGGTAVLADHVPEYDATVVTRLEAAGAVILGKLHLTEGAMGGYHPQFPAPVNPWNAESWAGSSSSGSGVATAAGLAYATLGSDTGGSIRFPAAACGVVGLKPTWGRVSRYGVLALAESLDHVGPLARSSADAALMLQTIAGYDPNDHTSLPYPAPEMLAELERGVKGIRIGLDEKATTQEVDPEVAEGVLAGVRVLEALGAEIVEVKLPDFERYLPAWVILCSAEAAVAHEANYPARRQDYGPWFRDWLNLGSGISGADYAKANQLRADCTGRLRAIFEEIDLLACPTMPLLPYPVTPEMLYGRRPKGIPLSRQRFTAPFNFNGAPTLSLPCGLSQSSLPLSLQLVGRPLGEPLLCRAGQAYEQATEWHKLHPPLENLVSPQ
jgi:amidase